MLVVLAFMALPDVWAFEPKSWDELKSAVNTCNEPQVTPDPLDTVDGGQTAGLAGVTTQKSGWILKQNMESLPGSHYTIIDDKRNPVFEVLISKTILFLNPEGDRVAYLKKQFWAIHPVWTLFTFKPNYQGQKSTDSLVTIGESQVPLYLYGAIDGTVLTLLAEFNFYRYVPEDSIPWFSSPLETKVETKVKVWSAKVIIAWRFKLGVRKVDGTSAHTEEIAKIGQEAFFKFDSTTEFAVVAAKGVDCLEILAFTVACQKIMEDDKYILDLHGTKAIEALRPKSWEEVKREANAETGNHPRVTLDSLDKVEGGQTTGIAGVTTHKCGWTLQKTRESMDGAHYTIIDEKRNPVFEVFIHDGILFLDSEGERVAYLKQNFYIMKPSWTLYTFQPNYEGQRGTSGPWVGTVYPYGYVDCTVMRRLPEFRFYRYRPNENRTWYNKMYLEREYKEDMWFANLIVPWKLKLDVRKVDTKKGIAMIGQDAQFTFNEDTEFPVVAAPGVARLELFAFTLACEQIIQDVVDYLKREEPRDDIADAEPMRLDYADGKQTTGLAGVTKHKSGWILQRNIASMPPSGYTILDEYRNPVFTVSGKLSDKRSGMVFTDAKENMVAYLKKTPTISRPRTWTLFAFEPVYTGQKKAGQVILSTESTWGVSKKYELYRYAMIDSTFLSHMGEFHYYRFLPNVIQSKSRLFNWFRNSTTTKKDVMFARVRHDIGFNLDVRSVGKEEGIAQIGQEAFFSFHPATEYAVVAATGVDRFGLLAFTIVTQTIMESIPHEEKPKSVLPEAVTQETTTPKTLWVVDEMNNEIEYIGD